MIGPDFLFACATCGRNVKDYANAYRKGRERQLAPVCRYCEGWYGARSPDGGSFMDRRKAVQISALAEVLNAEASIKQWEARRGRS